MSQETIDVEYVAKLARLDLTQEEIETFQTQLEDVLEHVAELTAVEIPEALKTGSESAMAIMRNDEPGSSLSAEAMLANAPIEAQQQIRVPKVVADA